MHYRPLIKRTFKYKNRGAIFYCPLCHSERSFTVNYKLSAKNFLQIMMITILVVLLLFPLMSFRSLWAFFFVWGVFELGVRWLFRRQIPCPHCGFDAAWYKKDVKMARRLVNEFWQKIDSDREIDVTVDELQNEVNTL